MSDDKKLSLKTPVGRLSYPHLFKNETYKGKDTGKKTCSLLIPKDFSIELKGWDADAQSDLFDAIRKEAANAIVRKFGRDKTKWPAGLSTNPFKDGDRMQDRPGHAGHWVIKAKTQFDFPIINGAREKITESKDIPAGCYAWMYISVDAYGDRTKGGLSIYLNGVQRVGKGVPFEGASRAAFDDIESEDELDSNFGPPAGAGVDEDFDQDEDLVFD